MSDGIERLCNQHPHLGPLRSIGSTYVCVDGHACPVDWHVKTTGLPYSTPVARQCPISGTRLLGSGEILQCPGSGAHQEHEVSTRLSDRPAPKQVARPKAGESRVSPAPPSTWLGVRAVEADVVKPVSVKEKAMRRKRGQVEHGTITMYANRKCRCEKCRECAREYSQRRKAARMAEQGQPTKAGRKAGAVVAKKASKARRFAGRGTLQLVGLKSAGGAGELVRLAERIEALRVETAEVEKAFAAAANRLMASHRAVPVVEAERLS